MGRNVRLCPPVLSHCQQLRCHCCAGAVHTCPMFLLVLQPWLSPCAGGWWCRACASTDSTPCCGSAGPVPQPRCTASDLLTPELTAVCARCQLRECLDPQMRSVCHMPERYLGMCNALARGISLPSIWVLKKEQSGLPGGEARAEMSVHNMREVSVQINKPFLSFYFRECQTFPILRLMSVCILYTVVKASLH